MRPAPLLCAALTALSLISPGAVTAQAAPAPAAAAAEVPAPAGPATLIVPGAPPVTLSADTLAALPQEEVDVTYRTSKGERHEHYRGPRLWSVLQAAGVGRDDHKAALGQIVVLTASDDYKVAFSLGEIMPDFGDRPILLADQVDGAPTPDGLRAVAVGDKRGGRYIKGITRIELR